MLKCLFLLLLLSTGWCCCDGGVIPLQVGKKHSFVQRSPFERQSCNRRYQYNATNYRVEDGTSTVCAVTDAVPHGTSIDSSWQGLPKCSKSQGFSEATLPASSPTPVEALDALGSDIGEPQIIDIHHGEEIKAIIQQGRQYIQSTVLVNDAYSKVRSLCRNNNAQCAFWASLGECDKNPGFMKLQCAPVCQSCDMLHIETRCPLDPHAIDALRPGDLDVLFERIVTEPAFQRFEPQVLSRPDYALGDSPETATYSVGGIWLVQFNAALSYDEADRLVELGSKRGYERSADVGAEKADGTFDSFINEGRTSTNAWCTDECYTDPVAQTVMERIANITGIPEANSENFQLLRYQPQQYYHTHNDYIEYQVDRPCGARILTFYMYLKDVERGGGTHFPHLNMTVQPRKGRAVLWPSVLNSHPHYKDHRSDHQALPVESGVKYGANAWIHQRDFKTNNAMGCA